MVNKISVYNTLSRKKELFEPQNKDVVNMYVCGITPYDECHLGHARCYVVFDVIRRYLEYKGYKVNYVQNFTDIDDKIIERSKKTGIKCKELADKYIEKYFKYCDKLDIKTASRYPRVTEHIAQIIKGVKKLIEKGYAYVAGGDVYFSVRKFPNYGKLSKRNIDELQTEARVQPDENKKEPLDFALWKARDNSDEPCWDSPWGKGRPGWHIECSIMSIQYLDETLDIHGGGQDLIFPHHENEIAQSESLTDKEFAKYWIHNGFVTINKQKMSKSLGNFFTLREIFEKYTPPTVRYFLLSQHYRTPIDFSDEKLEQAKIAMTRLARTIENISTFLESRVDKGKTQITSDVKGEEIGSIKSYVEKFESAMNDDFNTELAIGYLHELCSLANTELNKKTGVNVNFIQYYKNEITVLSEQILGLNFKQMEKSGITEEMRQKIEGLLKERENARKNKDWQKGDTIRKQLQDMGVVVEDTPSGQRWYLKS